MKILLLSETHRIADYKMAEFISNHRAVIEDISKARMVVKLRGGLEFWFRCTEDNLRGIEINAVIIDDDVPGSAAMEALTRLR